MLGGKLVLKTVVGAVLGGMEQDLNRKDAKEGSFLRLG